MAFGRESEVWYICWSVPISWTVFDRLHRIPEKAFTSPSVWEHSRYTMTCDVLHTGNCKQCQVEFSAVKKDTARPEGQPNFFRLYRKKKQSITRGKLIHKPRMHSHLVHLALSASSSHWYSLVCGKWVTGYIPLTTEHIPSAEPFLWPP